MSAQSSQLRLKVVPLSKAIQWMTDRVWALAHRIITGEWPTFAEWQERWWRVWYPRLTERER